MRPDSGRSSFPLFSPLPSLLLCVRVASGHFGRQLILALRLEDEVPSVALALSSGTQLTLLSKQGLPGGEG